MKTRSILIMPLALVLAACATPPTLDELEFQALQTGDWSAVEKRERSMARRAVREIPDCASDLVPVCRDSWGENDCHCVSRRSIKEMFSRY